MNRKTNHTRQVAKIIFLGMLVAGGLLVGRVEEWSISGKLDAARRLEAASSGPAFPTAEEVGAILVSGVFRWFGVTLDVEEVAQASQSIPAFPGAEGFGANAVGGRGGQVIEVTNLNDSGPGSLRAAIEAQGPRIVVFRVGGTIELQSNLKISHPFITIAGQTAPGGGITIKGGTLRIETHNVIIRYIRVRVGPTPYRGEDGLSLTQARHVIVDHSSFSWATDENASVAVQSLEITIQWCIIAEGLHHSTHPDGPHSMGSLLSTGARKISLHHNLYAHNDERNPKLKGDPEYLAGRTAIFDFVNNVIYNWGNYATAVAGSAKANVVGNYYKLGPDSYGYTSLGNGEVILWQRERRRSLFIQGNVGPSCPEGCADDWDMVTHFASDPGGRGDQASTGQPVAPVTTTSAFEAYEQVLASAGATRPMRDAVDERIVNDVTNGTGHIIDDPSEVGGWPALASGTPPDDRDHDGMPDDWETNYGFDPDDPTDGPKDADQDGYTNVEEYLNETDPGSGEAIPTNTPPPTSTEMTTPVATSTSTVGPLPTPAVPFSRSFEAEGMSLLPPMVVGSDGGASGGQYISPETGEASSAPVPEATLDFEVPEAGVYYLWIRMLGPDTDHDALYVGIDDVWDRVFPEDATVYEWVRVEVTHLSEAFGFTLDRGTHTLRIGHGEIGARADALFLTNDPNEPPPPIAPAPTPTPTATPDGGPTPVPCLACVLFLPFIMAGVLSHGSGLDRPALTGTELWPIEA